MNNIRVSIDLTKVDGARTIRAAAPNGKQEYYVAIPVSSLFLPKDSKSAHLTCTMIPCPNAIYGDFMLKKYINGTTYANMSREEREKVPIIGKGTYIVPKMEKSQAQAYAPAEVVSADLDDVRGQQDPNGNPPTGQTEGTAPSTIAPFPANGGTPEATELYVVDENDQWWKCAHFEQARQFAEQKDPEKCRIVVTKGGEVIEQYNFDNFYQQWAKSAIS